VVMVTPRVFYALGQDGVFLRSLSYLHPRFRTPVRALVLQGVWASALVIIGNIDLLVNGVVFADWIFFGLGAASLFVLRRQHLSDDVAYRTPGYPVVPGFFVFAAIIAVASAIGSYPRQSLVGVAMLIGGAVVFEWKRRRS
jgi:APA family basic amino acid/polyamine antiporter